MTRTCGVNENSRFSNAGSTYSSFAGTAGGIEFRFDEPTSIETFKAHCIRNLVGSDTCGHDDSFGFTKLSVQYWADGAWQLARRLDATTGEGSTNFVDRADSTGTMYARQG
jgi:hypothetical protein